MQLHHRFSFWLALPLLVGLLGLLGSSGCSKSQAGCRSDNECPGGACVVGQCRATTGADLAMGGSDGGDLGPMGDLATTPPDGWSPDAAPSCTIVSDGVITRAELPIQVGLGGLFAVNAAGSTVPVTTVPQSGGWDYSAAVSNERKVFDQLMSPSGAWWQGDFPEATYAERLDDSSGLLGIYQATPDALNLIGIVSETDAYPSTSLKYTTPIPLLKLPLMMGKSWMEGSDVTGLYQGVAVFGDHEDWKMTVDARGPTKVPLGTFDTLRVRIDYHQTYGFLDTTRIILLHMTECYGAVARLRSVDNEPSADFTQASEYRRLTVP
jgi:hypothetical protein